MDSILNFKAFDYKQHARWSKGNQVYTRVNLNLGTSEYIVKEIMNC